MTEEYMIDLLKLAQSGDNVATDNLITNIRDKEMNRRIGRYYHKNRQVDDDDIRQEFLIGVALAIQKADLTIGDPIEYLIAQGVYKVRSYMRKHIIQNTTQICMDCGYESRLNRVNGEYICKKCGGHNIETRETNDYDDVALEMICTEEDAILNAIDDIGAEKIIEEFRRTLDPTTKVYHLFVLLYDEDINSSNPEIKNYISEIAKRWNTSQTLVVQVREKLQRRLQKYCDDMKIKIVNNKFVVD